MASIVPRRIGNGTTSYQVRWREAGHQRSMIASGATDAQRRRHAEDLKRTIELHGHLPADHQPDPDVPTFTAWAAHHLAHLTGVSDRTRDDYTRQVAAHMGDLAELPISEVTRDVVRRWVLDRRRHVSGKTLKNLHGLLHGILAGAVEAGHLDHNPARGVRLPRTDDHERRDTAFLTQDEFWAVADELDDHWRPYFILLAGTGLRLGELMALTVGDIDAKAHPPVVHVTKAQRYTKGRGFETGPTKTRRSRRTIALDQTALEALRQHLNRPADQPLVVGPGGRRVYPTNLYARIWRPAVTRAQGNGLTKNPRIHDLRHTHASWLIAQGLPLPLIQSRLGHEQISTTVDRYGHLLPDLHVQAALATTRSLERPAALEDPGGP